MVVDSTKNWKPPIICILIKETTQPKRQSHFLEPVTSRFDFFLVFCDLYSPFLSNCNVNVYLFKLDLSIDIVNPALSACRRIQPNKSSRPRRLSFVKKYKGDIYFITAKLGNTGRYRFRFSSM